MTRPATLPITGIDAHAHVFRHDLPMVANRRYSPGYDALAEDFLARLDAAGLSHGVLIQPSFLGTDNSFILDALRRIPNRLRAVAVVDPTICEMALDELEQAGVVGVRLNLIGLDLDDFAKPQWQSFFRQMARRRWSVEIQRGMPDLPAIVPVILNAGAHVVIDHFGLPKGTPDESFLKLLANDKVWIKLSAAYRSSTSLNDAQKLVALFRDAAKGVDRFVWGSDWPHTQHEKDTDHGAQLAFFKAVLPDLNEQQKVLVDNPRRLFQF